MFVGPDMDSKCCTLDTTSLFMDGDDKMRRFDRSRVSLGLNNETTAKPATSNSANDRGSGVPTAGAFSPCWDAALTVKSAGVIGLPVRLRVSNAEVFKSSE